MGICKAPLGNPKGDEAASPVTLSGGALTLDIAGVPTDMFSPDPPEQTFPRDNPPTTPLDTNSGVIRASSANDKLVVATPILVHSGSSNLPNELTTRPATQPTSDLANIRVVIKDSPSNSNKPLHPSMVLDNVPPSNNKIVQHWQDMIHRLQDKMVLLQVEPTKEMSAIAEAEHLAEIASLRTKIQIYSQYLEDEPTSKRNNCCSIFIAESVHSLCVILLTVCTVPWNVVIFCAPPQRKWVAGLAKLLLAFSLLINLFLLFGPFPIASLKTTSSHDLFTKFERSLTVVAVTWALIHMHVFSCFGPGPSIQQALLNLCGVPNSPRVIRHDFYGEYDTYFRIFSCCGFTEQNFYFLRLTSTLAFLISISAGLFFAFGFELLHMTADYPPFVLFAIAGGALFVWFLTMKIICLAMVSAYGNFSLHSMGSPLLGNDHSDNTSIIHQFSPHSDKLL